MREGALPPQPLDLNPGLGFRGIEVMVYGAVLLFVLVAGLVKVDVPLHGDQALFLYFAGQLDAGAALYQDIWDVKPPAVFAFYGAATHLFGFSDRAVHLFELCWMVVFAFALMLGLRGYLRHPWLSAVVPAAVIGTYYVHANVQAQTQVEILVGLPMFLSIWFLSRGVSTSSGRFVTILASGLLAAVTTAFKPIFALLFIAFVLAATVRVLRSGRSDPVGTVLFGLWLPFTVGVVAVWGAIALWFVIQGTFYPFFWTAFLFPVEALGQVPGAPLSRIATAALLYVAAWAPWLVFVLLTVPLVWRRDEPVLTLLMWTWLVGGIAVIALQRPSWWAYHWMLLFCPTGVLAVRGVDALLAWLRQRLSLSPLLAMALSALFVLPALGGLLFPIGENGRRALAALTGGPEARDAFKRSDERYAGAADAAAFLRAQGRPGTIFVFGTPLIYVLADRQQEGAIPGWIWEVLLPEQRQAMVAHFTAQPPAYVFVEKLTFESFVPSAAPAMADLLSQRYRVVWDHPFGRWYGREDLAGPDPAPVPSGVGG
jgi:hypothetical protein